MHSPNTELRHKRFPTERVLREIVPMLETEYLSWGNIKMVTAGLGEEISNHDLIGFLNEDVTKALGLIGENNNFYPEIIENLTGFKTKPQLINYASDSKLTVEKGFSLLNKVTTNIGRLALENQGWKPQEVDILVTLGSYPENDYAYVIRDELGADNASIIEATNACSSPAVALLHLKQLQKYFPDGAKTLITGAEIFTPFTDPKDLILFSDRAGALTFKLGKDIKILTPYEPGVTVREDPDADDAFNIAQPHYQTEGMQTSGGVIFTRIEEKDGRVNIISRTRYPDSEFLKDPQILVSMNGIKVAKWMVRETPGLITDTVEASDVSWEEIKIIIPHQANGRLLTMLQRKLARVTTTDELPPVYWCGENIGNCVSQTTFYALMKALEGKDISEEDKIQNGDKLLVTAFGAGLASAAAVIEVNHRS